MKRLLTIGTMMAALVSNSARADEVPAPPWETLLPAAAAVKTGPALPVTLDFSLPEEADFLARINSDASLPTPPSSKAEEALTVTVRGTSADLQPAPPVAGAPAAGPITPYTYETPAGGDYQYSSAPSSNRGGLLGGTGPIRHWLRNFQPDVYHDGTITMEYGSQRWTSPIIVNSPRAATMWPNVFRIGMMLNEPGEARVGKGVWEIMGESDNYVITSGVGNVIIGGSGLIRYHRKIRNHRIIPYLQAGFGGAWVNAVDPTVVAGPTSTNFNFITQVGAGSHIFLNKNWAIMTESSYTWIGNWGIGTGPGYHVLGGLIGITRFFK